MSKHEQQQKITKDLDLDTTLPYSPWKEIKTETDCLYNGFMKLNKALIMLSMCLA